MAQHSLGRVERAMNLGGVFGVIERHRHQVEGRWVVLIDDVSTTGATLSGLRRGAARGRCAGGLGADRGTGALNGARIIDAHRN